MLPQIRRFGESFEEMRSAGFLSGFLVITLLLVAANIWSYLSEQSDYYKALDESGMVWAGHWTWGAPFKMVMAGLGFDNHSVLMPLAFVLNVLVWVTGGGIAGVSVEFLISRFRNRN